MNIGPGPALTQNIINIHAKQQELQHFHHYTPLLAALSQNKLGVKRLNIYACFHCILGDPDVKAQTAPPSIFQHMR